MKKSMLIILIAGLFNAGVSHAMETNFKNDTNENSQGLIASDLSGFFAAADLFFDNYVSGGRVDYAAIKAEAVSINSLVETISKADLSSAGKDTKTAFYINAYNILVMKSIIDNMPINSPLDAKGFFDVKKHTIAGESLTLNEIENKKLRPDPRVHFALVCAAKGCPKIMNEAYMPDNVQAQLDSQAKKALNDAAFIQVDDSQKKAKISHIFEWYSDDFVKSSGSAREFINKYRSADIPSDYTIEYYDYDWSLNKK